MKTLSAKIFCYNFKVYKLGLLIGFTYLIPNLLLAVLCFAKSNDNYILPLMCILTVLTSGLLILGLLQERLEYLFPWLANIAVLIVFNIILVVAQFEELNHLETKDSFYWEFIFFIVLEFQLICWYCIYCLMERGYRKRKRFTSTISTISKNMEGKDVYYKINLISSDQLNDEHKVISV